MSRIAEKKEEKRARLLEAAYHLYLRKGITATAVDEVVKLAGVAKGTFYLYFEDKYDLLDQITITKSAEIIRIALADLKKQNELKPMTPVEQGLFFVDRIIAFFKSNKIAVPLISRNLTACYKILAHRGNEELKRGIEEITGIIAMCGYTREQSYRHLYMLTTLVGTLCFDAITKGAPYEIDEVQDEIHSVIIKLFSNQQEKVSQTEPNVPPAMKG